MQGKIVFLRKVVPILNTFISASIPNFNNLIGIGDFEGTYLLFHQPIEQQIQETYPQSSLVKNVAHVRLFWSSSFYPELNPNLGLKFDLKTV